MIRSGQHAKQGSLRPRLGDSRLAGRQLPPLCAPRRHDPVSRFVEFAVVPRLVWARRTVAFAADGRGQDAAAEPAASGMVGPGRDSVAELTTLLLKRDAATAASYVAALHARGIGAEALCLDLLAPAARRMDDLWAEDVCSSADVTLGMVRLRQALHGLGPAFQAKAGCGAAPGPHVLLAPVPGDQHTFGLAMVACFFRRAGWTVHGGIVASLAELTTAVRSQPFDIIGLSASCDRHLGPLAGCIRAMRAASCNQALGVLVGGPVFARHPKAAICVGADAAAADARQAPAQALALLAALQEPGRPCPR